MMADERDKRSEDQRKLDELRKKTGKREIGEGMHSPDSTQVPLKADTGEPDWEAIKGRIDSDRANEDH
jgi:hypothetical protein